MTITGLLPEAASGWTAVHKVIRDVSASGNWPFDQPPNAAAITLRSIVSGGAPILHVTHDSDDHGWQFLGAEDADAANACIAGMGEILAMDPSVAEVADLPPGWHAWRSSSSSPWSRAPNPREED